MLIKFNLKKNKIADLEIDEIGKLILGLILLMILIYIVSYLIGGQFTLQSEKLKGSFKIFN